MRGGTEEEKKTGKKKGWSGRQGEEGGGVGEKIRGSHASVWGKGVRMEAW